MEKSSTLTAEQAIILESIGRHIHLDEEEQLFFISLLARKTLQRKEFLQAKGNVCKYSCFVLSGCLRGFTVDKKGLEHVLSFAPKGWWMADLYSLITQKPGQLQIEALEETEIFLLSKTHQEELYVRVPKFERFFRILVENSLVAHQQRLIDNFSLSAEERYLKFCETYPTLIHHLPQKQIASYIGVTQEFFSRMRTNLLKK